MTRRLRDSLCELRPRIIAPTGGLPVALADSDFPQGQMPRGMKR